MTDTLISALGSIFPPGRLLTQAAQVAPYECDALTAMRVRPRAVVLAESQQEVIDTVRLCNRLRVPFVARGSGTSLSGGSLPIAEGIVIALNRLNRVLKLDPDARIAVVEPGVINLNVTKAAAPYGLYYAPDPASQSVCTVGGNIAFNSGGVHCLKYGMTSNHILGLKVVLADGEVVSFGSESLEATGPDLPGFFVGSEGLFGIALEATLRLIPRVETYRTVLAAYRTLEAAGNAVAMVVASGLLPGAMEIMDPLAIKATEEAAHAGYPLDAGGLMIVELEGEAVQVEVEFERLLEVIRESGAYQIRAAQNDAERLLIWKGRKGAFSAVGRLSPQYVVQDGVVPRSSLGEALASIEALSQKYSLPVANVFHAGDGNLHPLILYDARITGAYDRAEEMASEILDLCIGLGGSITGEHGIGMEKRAHLPRMFSEYDMATMTRMRRAMDPLEIANRGKMLQVAGNGDRLSVISDQSSVASGQLRRETDRGKSGPADVVQPQNLAELQYVVRSCERLVVRGGGSKHALSAAQDGTMVLDMRGLRGIVEYVPDEFTFTALAGTPVSDVAAMLAEHGQYLPFDPPLADAGATLGGTVAAGLSGPGRYRYGGVRDFILGVRFVDGHGSVVRGGGKVVKNAAGFDFPKLMVGSLGRLGVLAELSFKVFPQPHVFATLIFPYTDLTEAQADMQRLTRQPLDIEAIDLTVPGEIDSTGVTLYVRIGGLAETLTLRIDRLQALLRAVAGDLQVATGDEEAGLWRAAREFTWAPHKLPLVKTPCNAVKLARLADALIRGAGDQTGDMCLRFSVAGNVAWIAWPGDLRGDALALDTILSQAGLPGLVLRGATGGPHIGAPIPQANAFYRRVKGVLDPHGRFGS